MRPWLNLVGGGPWEAALQETCAQDARGSAAYLALQTSSTPTRCSESGHYGLGAG